MVFSKNTKKVSKGLSCLLERNTTRSIKNMVPKKIEFCVFECDKIVSIFSEDQGLLFTSPVSKKKMCCYILKHIILDASLKLVLNCITNK